MREHELGGTPGGPAPANGHEEAARRLEAAEEAAQQATRTTRDQGPALQHTAHAVLQVLKYAELLGIQLAELRDAFARAQAVDAGREMAELGELIDRAGPLLATGPDEIAARFDAARAGVPYLDPAPRTVAGTTHASTLMLPMPAGDVARLAAAAENSGLTVVEFATAAILDAVALVERGKQ